MIFVIVTHNLCKRYQILSFAILTPFGTGRLCNLDNGKTSVDFL